MTLGRSRFEFTTKSTIGDFKIQLKERLNIEPKTAALFADQGLRKRIQGLDT